MGRSNSPTDNAPIDTYDTTIMLKPREQWRSGMTYEKLIREIDERLQFPGLTNTWTMPVQNRLDMELTGIKTPVRLKISRPKCGSDSTGRGAITTDLGRHPGTPVRIRRTRRGGFLHQIEVNRLEAARYGLTVADVPSSTKTLKQQPSKGPYKDCGQN